MIPNKRRLWSSASAISLPPCLDVSARICPPPSAARIECMLCATYNLRESVAQHLPCSSHVSCSAYDTFAADDFQRQISAILCGVLSTTNNSLHPRPPSLSSIVGPVQKDIVSAASVATIGPPITIAVALPITPHFITRIGATCPSPHRTHRLFPSCRRSQPLSPTHRPLIFLNFSNKHACTRQHRHTSPFCHSATTDSPRRRQKWPGLRS